MNNLLIASSFLLLVVCLLLLHKNKNLMRAIGDTVDSEPSETTELKRMFETGISQALQLFNVIVMENNAEEAKRDYVIAFVLLYNGEDWFESTFTKHKELTEATVKIIEPIATGGILDTAPLSSRIAYAELSEAYDHLKRILET